MVQLDSFCVNAALRIGDGMEIQSRYMFRPGPASRYTNLTRHQQKTPATKLRQANVYQNVVSIETRS